MAATFPTSPINGETAVVNSITYVYASAQQSWTRVPGEAGGGGTPGGANTQIQYNDATAFNGSAAFTFNKVSNAVVATGNVTVGNLLTAGLVSATGNISGANVVASANLVSAGAVVLGNITGGNLITSGLITATGNVTGGNLIVGGNIVDTSALSIITSSNGNITLAPNGTGVVVINTDLRNGQANGVGNIGSSTAYFNTAFVKATSAQYADLAEMYQGDESYMPGTVVEFGGTHEITITTEVSSTRIAGVVSTNPSYLMNSGLNTLCAVPVALTGRVPCQVIGPVRKGDRLVSSMLPGVAQVLDDETYRPGCMIGKSLEDWPEATVKLIEVVVGRL
jgi:hypothetical protein